MYNFDLNVAVFTGATEVAAGPTTSAIAKMAVVDCEFSRQHLTF